MSAGYFTVEDVRRHLGNDFGVPRAENALTTRLADFVARDVDQQGRAVFVWMFAGLEPATRLGISVVAWCRGPARSRAAAAAMPSWAVEAFHPIEQIRAAPEQSIDALLLAIRAEARRRGWGRPAFRIGTRDPKRLS